MQNELRSIEKMLRSFSKRCKNLTYTKELLFSFLMTGALSYGVNLKKDEGSEKEKKKITNSIEDMKKLFIKSRNNNNKLLKNANLELIQLMEQGDHVVKSPWSSWQSGGNYYYSDWQGTYKGKGDKKDKAQVFERETGASKYSYNISRNSSGTVTLDLDKTREPRSTVVMDAGINPRPISIPTINRLAKTVSVQNNAEAVQFSPVTPTVPQITITVPTISAPTLSALYNGDTPPSSQYQWQSGNHTITDGTTFSRTWTTGTYLSSPYTKTQTFSNTHVYKTSEAFDYKNFLGYVKGNRIDVRDYQYGAIFEFGSGTFNINGLTMEVNEVRDRTGNTVMPGNRAISTDSGNTNVVVTSNSNIKLTANGSVAFATDTGGDTPGTNNHNRIDTNGTNGFIYSTGTGNSAFMFTLEQIDNTLNYQNINDGTIIMTGANSTGFANNSHASFSSSNYKGIMKVSQKNNGTIVTTGDNSYGMALGNNRWFNSDYSVINNTGNIYILGKNSVGIALQREINSENSKNIYVGGNNSMGIYSSAATKIGTGTGESGWDYGSSVPTVTNKTVKVENSGLIEIGKIDYTYSRQVANGTSATGDTWGTSFTGSNDVLNAIGIMTNGDNSLIKNTVSGKVIINSGHENIGAYSKAGTVQNDGTITISAGDNIGMYADGSKAKIINANTVNVTGDASIGLMTTNNGTVQNIGMLTVSGGNFIKTHSSDSSLIGKEIGTTGILAATGTVDSSAGTVTINVKDDKSNAVYAGNGGIIKIGKSSAGTIESAINATDGAVNFYVANGGNVEISAGAAATAITGEKSILFYNLGTINFAGNLTATVKGSPDLTATGTSTRGTAFYVPTPTTGLTAGTAGYNSAISYGNFGTPEINNYFTTKFNNIGNLTLNMETGSRLFAVSNVKTDLTSASLGAVSGPVVTAVSGTKDYKDFMLYQSELTVNKNVNLDDTTDIYNTLEIANSSIINQAAMSGSKTGIIAMAQEAKGIKGYATLLNDTAGNIALSGINSVAMYAKNGYTVNKGQITLTGNDSVGLFGEENTTVLNDTPGTITLNGTGSTGLYFENSSTTNLTKEKIINAGNINGTATSSVGIFYNPNELDSTAVGTALVENRGDITFAGDKNVGIYAEKDKNNAGYIVENKRDITLTTASASLQDPNVGVFANSENIQIRNDAGTNIKVSDRSVGIYGHTVDNNGNITVGDAGVAIYSQSGNVNVNSGTITTGENNAVGVYTTGDGQTVTIANGADLSIGTGSIGIANVNSSKLAGNQIVSNAASVNLKDGSVYIYSVDTLGTVNNNTNITSTGTAGNNFGIYSNGNVTNTGTINLSSGIGNVGIYVYDTAGKALNTGTISVGASNSTTDSYSIGMAAKNGATVENASGRTINVTGDGGIGMYATGSGSKAINRGNIDLSGNNSIGMYLDDNAVGENYGTIQTTATSTGDGIIGVYTINNSVIKNYGTIRIVSKNGIGVYVSANSDLNPNGNITASGTGSEAIYKSSASDTSKGVEGISLDLPAIGSPTAIVTREGKIISPSVVDTDSVTPNPNYIKAGATTIDLSTFNSLYTENNGGGKADIGMYVDTSGVNYTNPIEGLENLNNLRTVNLLFGVEAAQYTTAKDIIVGDNIITPYKTAIKTVNLKNPAVKWDILSGNLTWIATATQNSATSEIEKVYLSKIPYTSFAAAEDKDTYNFLAGLEQRYGVEEIGSRENQIFQKLNDLGNGESHILAQAIDEMKGHQYANVQQRIYGTGRMLDKEITHLSNEWATKSKESNKIKAFGMRDEYNTDTAGIIDYKSDAYGFAYVHEDETVKLGNTTGWYAGAVHNRIRFKDIGNSKENTTMLKAGIFKSTAFDHNGSLKWTISGEGYVARSNMHRKYLVVDEIFEAKSDYSSYGVAIKNEIGKEFRTSERTSIRPYGSLKLEYGRFSDIEEKSGEVRLEVQGNDYYSIRPEAGVEFKYKQPMAIKTNFVTTLGVGYESELGKVGDVGNKARVNYTTADWYNLSNEKENRKGNFKADLNIGIENQRFGVTLNAGYDAKGENIRGGIGFRAIY